MASKPPDHDTARHIARQAVEQAAFPGIEDSLRLARCYLDLWEKWDATVMRLQADRLNALARAEKAEARLAVELSKQDD